MIFNEKIIDVFFRKISGKIVGNFPEKKENFRKFSGLHITTGN